jgi:hypothetical protein
MHCSITFCIVSMKVFATVSINDTQHNSAAIMLSVVILSVAFKYMFMLNVIMLSAVMLSAIMPSVVVSMDGENPRALSGQINRKKPKTFSAAFSNWQDNDVSLKHNNSGNNYLFNF